MERKFPTTWWSWRVVFLVISGGEKIISRGVFFELNVRKTLFSELFSSFQISNFPVCEIVRLLPEVVAIDG